MKTEKNIWSLLDRLRGELNQSDTLELLFIISLIRFLEVDDRYSDAITMKSLFEDDQAHVRLKKMMDRIEKEIPYFEDVFIHFTVLNNVNTTLLHELILVIDAVDMKGIGYGKWCQYLIDGFEGHTKTGGGHTSPHTINQLAIEILSATSGSFYDGTFGLGDGIVKAMKYSWEDQGELQVCGQEVNGRVYALTKIRFFLIGEEEAILKNGDIFSEPKFTVNNRVKQFDYVYMDIPKSSMINFDFTHDPNNRFIYGSPSHRGGDLGYISHMLASLNDTGRGVIIVADGILFRSGTDATIRKNIIDSNVIEAVISLPARLYDNTAISVSLIVFNKDKARINEDAIHFINAREHFVEDGFSGRYISAESISRIVDVVQTKSEVEELSVFLKNNEIEDGNLLPSRYIMRSEKEVSGYGKVKLHLEELARLKMVPLKSKVDFISGYNVGSKDKESANGEFSIIKLSDVDNGKLDVDAISLYEVENRSLIKRYLLEENDIILSTRGTSLKVAVVPAHDKPMLLSQNFIGIRCGFNLNPHFLKAYLESPVGKFLLMNQLSGSSTVTLRRKDIDSINIPDMSIVEQDGMMGEYVRKEQLVEERIAELERELESEKLSVLDGMGLSGVYEIVEK